MKGFQVHFAYVLSICLLIPVIFYCVNFFNGGLSHEVADWSAFGDYFGGVLGVIIALANLLVFVKLTLFISELQEKAGENALSLEREKLKAEFTYRSFESILSQLIKLTDDLYNAKNKYWLVLRTKNRLSTSKNIYISVYKIDERAIESVEDALGNLLACLDPSDSLDEKSKEELKKTIPDYLEKCSSLEEEFHKKITISVR